MAKYIYAPLPFVMAQPKLKVDRFVQLLRENGFDGFHFHLNSPWCKFGPKQKNFTFWTDGNQWKEQFEDLAAASADNGLIMHVTIHDQYAQKGKLKGPLSTMSEKYLYESLIAPFPPTLPRSEQLKRFAHIAWYYQDTAPPSTYDLVGPGAEFERQIRFVFETFASERIRRPVRSKFWVTLKNEEYTALNSAGNKTEGLGGADKLKLRMLWLAKDSALTFNAKVRFVINFYNPLDRKRAYLIDPVTGANYVHPRTWTNVKGSIMKPPMNAMWECHHIEGPKEVDLIRKNGVDLSRVILHTDGTADTPKGVKETVAAIKNTQTFYAVKAGKAGAVPDSLLAKQNEFFEYTIPICGELIK